METETMPKRFSEFKIKSRLPEAFVGDKIKIERLFNREITVTRFKIEPSTAKLGTERLCLEILVKEEKHILFTGSLSMMDSIKQVPEFPFITTIVKEDERFIFT